MKKRYKIVNKARFITFLLVLVLISSIFVYTGVKADERTEFKIVRVKEGDNLWKIAEENYDFEKEDIRQYIYKIKKINKLSDSGIYTNQELILPY